MGNGSLSYFFDVYSVTLSKVEKYFYHLCKKQTTFFSLFLYWIKEGHQDLHQDWTKFDAESIAIG